MTKEDARPWVEEEHRSCIDIQIALAARAETAEGAARLAITQRDAAEAQARGFEHACELIAEKCERLREERDEAVKLLREMTRNSFGSEVADAAFEARAFLSRLDAVDD